MTRTEPSTVDGRGHLDVSTNLGPDLAPKDD